MKVKKIRLEDIKLTEKQLQTNTSMDNGKGAIATIGDLTLDQLRTLLYKEMQEQKFIEKHLWKIANTLDLIMP